MNIKRTRNDLFYFHIALRNYSAYMNAAKVMKTKHHFELLKKEVDDLFSDIEGRELDAETSGRLKSHPLFDFIIRVRVWGTVTIVFSALCLEALINDYAILNLSRQYFEKHLDKISTPSKWLLIPQLVKGKSIPPDSQAYELVSSLFALRNKLVHPKSRQLDSIAGETDKSLMEELKALPKYIKNSILAVKCAAKGLWSIDKNFRYLEDYEFLWNKKARKPEKTSVGYLMETLIGNSSMDSDIGA